MAEGQENRHSRIDPPEIEIVHTNRVSCEGGGVLGHPRVWYSIAEDRGWVECGYCDKKFILAGGPADQGG